jgi:hypothetical protein
VLNAQRATFSRAKMAFRPILMKALWFAVFFKAMFGHENQQQEGREWRVAPRLREQPPAASASSRTPPSA